MRTPQLMAALSVFVAGVFGYAALAPPDRPAPVTTAADSTAPAGPASAGGPSASAASAVYDVGPLIKPSEKYLGVAIAGAAQDISRVDAFAKRTGGKPNMVTIYEAFNDGFAASEARRIHAYGALPILRWEPFKQKLSDIADGRYDPYVREFAGDVKRVNVPVALTVAHEMNGHWYPWGTQQNSPKDFVAAWKHLHEVFEEVGATNVIWTWTPNVVNYLRKAPLKGYWPGAAYVDWVGLDGYFTYGGEQTFKTLFQPTLTELRKFTGKPVLIVETGAEPGTMRTNAVRDLFTSIARDRNLIGFVYFNQKGSADWVIDFDQKTQVEFKTNRYRSNFGFPVR